MRPARNFSHTEVSCLNTSTLALAANVARVSALLINDSDEVIYLMFGADAELNKGVRLNPSGGSYELSIVEGSVINSVVNCIHASSGKKNLLVLERDNK